ncbi:MAG: septal ring lytic transglycosylase RlpA family protein [Bryobacterales bacterium]|nr:septal ring lytic transglycosylase RlpA family protein [Bryobacterales bacterium]
MRKLLAVAACCALLTAACGRRKRVSVPAPAAIGSVESGIASWYGNPYHGRAAANGEIYDMEAMTAAHRTLPFGTWVRVLNLTNNRTVEVRITDRGPFVDGRVIDLSRAAARAIEMIGPGTAPVRLEIIRRPAAAPAEAVEAYAVQVGAFQVYENAQRLRLAMEQRYGSARLVRREGAAPVWRVLVGAEGTLPDAGLLLERIRTENGSLHSGAFVVRLDSAGAEAQPR